MNKIYFCIDLKSFYASVECVERGLDPLNTNLVVADSSRTEKTVCLAVTPSLKSYKISGRARLYEVISKVKEINLERRKKVKRFIGKSYIDSDLKSNNNLELDFIIATPRMRYYMDYSTRIYNIYLKYVSFEDIYSYSIDEVFIDITEYLDYYKTSYEKLVMRMIEDVYKETGITATAGIGTNMYLAKIAMDIKAKKMSPNSFGVRMAYLDEELYKKEMWNHLPLTDFWRIGLGISKRLIDNNINTMGELARLSLVDEDKLYKLFGVNAELLIDHAWGVEPCTMKDVKNYRPNTNSMSRGQVLHTPYKFDDARLILEEMIDSLTIDIIKKELTTSQIVININYDVSNLKIGRIVNHYYGEFEYDRYGRKVPKKTRLTVNFYKSTNSLKVILDKVLSKYDSDVNPLLLIRKIEVNANNLIKKKERKVILTEQLDIFSDIDQKIEKEKNIKKNEEQEEKIQEAIIKIKEKFGSESILKGCNIEEKSTARERFRDVGGHRG